jgi:hypothetical protein
MKANKWRIAAAASLVASAFGAAVWMYCNRSSSVEKLDAKEERYLLVEQFAEMQNRNLI